MPKNVDRQMEIGDNIFQFPYSGYKKLSCRDLPSLLDDAPVNGRMLPARARLDSVHLRDCHFYTTPRCHSRIECELSISIRNVAADDGFVLPGLENRLCVGYCGECHSSRG